MTDRTPLEKLDDAIHEYIQAITGDDWNGAVSGWQLGIETTAIVNEEGALPLADAQWWTIGPQTTATQAVGLARYVSETLETLMVQRTLNQDDE